ncbi:MAG: cupin domain-containing protein [Bacteroidales bacterium]
MELEHPDMSFIAHNDAVQEYYFKEGCFITEFHNTESDNAVSIAQARVKPGETTRWHALLHTTERYIILSGTGSVEVGDDKPVLVGAHDVVCIPPDIPQRITNTGVDDLIFLAVCSPRFQQKQYIDLENV